MTCVVFASAGACASSAASIPVAASEPSPYADIVPLQVNGHPGVWMEEQAFDDILVGIVREKGDLKVVIAQQKVSIDMERARADELERIAKSSAWRSVWLPVVTFVGGVLVTGAAILGGIYAGQALQPRTP